MKALFFVLLSSVCLANQWNYSGEFSAIYSTGSPCDLVFQVTNYETKHFLAGPSHLTSVLYFSSPSKEGFLHGLSFVGGMGKSGDIRAEKEIQKEGHLFSFISEGIADQNVLYIKLSVVVRKASETPILCQGSAEYTGFR